MLQQDISEELLYNVLFDIWKLHLSEQLRLDLEEQFVKQHKKQQMQKV